MFKLVFKKYKALKGINNILILKLVGVGRNSIRSFLIYNINITVYIFSGIIIIEIINLKRAMSKLVPIKYIKVKNYKY
jgi:hypothetical protein